MEELAEIENQIQRIEEKLNELDLKRDKFYWFIPIAIFLPLVMPFIPRRGETMAEKYGYVTVMLLTAGFLLIVLPIAYFVEKRKIEDEEAILEEELGNLKKKKTKLKK